MSEVRLYLDTSVIGGCLDREFERWSLALMRDIRLGLFLSVVSDLTERELSRAPPDVQAVYDELMEIGTQRIKESAESLRLAQKYIREGILTDNCEDDARHVAVAAVSCVHVLVSWNFKHIVHYDKIRRFNAVNVLMGYSPLQIHTPMEVTYEEGV